LQGEEHAERPPVGGVVLTKITPEDEYSTSESPLVGGVVLTKITPEDEYVIVILHPPCLLVARHRVHGEVTTQVDTQPET
jgi:hypothetical protein